MIFDIYRKAFLSRNDDMWWADKALYRGWDDATIYLYFFIVAFTFFAAWRCYVFNDRKMALSEGGYVEKPQYSIWFGLTSLIFLCIMGMRGSWVGIDTEVYSVAIEDAKSLSAVFNDGTTTEPLYKLSLVVLHKLLPNRYCAIFTFSVAIVFFVFSTIKKYYQNICLLIAIPAFVCIYYFQSFNLIRITLAASFMLWSLHLLIEEKYMQYAIRIVIASLMHFSSIVLFFPLGILVLYKKNRMMAYFAAIISIFAIVFFSTYLGNYISLHHRYETYIIGNEASGKIGMALFFDYLPCLYISYYIIKRKITSHWADLMVCFTITAFIIRLLVYFIQIAGRLYMHFMPLIIILLPYWLSYLKQSDRNLYKILIPCCILWLCLKLHIYFTAYLSADGIMPYYFFWNE